MTKIYCDVCKKEITDVKVAVIEFFDCGPNEKRIELTVDLCQECQEHALTTLVEVGIFPKDRHNAAGLAR